MQAIFYKYKKKIFVLLGAFLAQSIFMSCQAQSQAVDASVDKNQQKLATNPILLREPPFFNDDELLAKFALLFSNDTSYINLKNVESTFDIKLNAIDKNTLVNKNDPSDIYGVHAYIEWYFDLFYWDINKERYGITMAWGNPPNVHPKAMPSSLYNFCLPYPKFIASMSDKGWATSENSLLNGIRQIELKKNKDKLQLIFTDENKCLVSMIFLGVKYPYK